LEKTTGQNFKIIGITQLHKNKLVIEIEATIWQDDSGLLNYPDLVGDDTATQTQTGNDNEATIDQNFWE
jgi:hypothetical protein